MNLYIVRHGQTALNVYDLGTADGMLMSDIKITGTYDDYLKLASENCGYKKYII